jgi:phospholipid/cholesterol/gamma-HCH transport system permease protein
VAEGPPKGNDRSARIEIAKDASGGLLLRASGDWVITGLGEADGAVRKLAAEGARANALDLAGVGRTDTAGAWLLHRLIELAPEHVAIRGLDPTLADLIVEITKHQQRVPDLPPRGNAYLEVVRRMGANVAAVGRGSVGMLGFNGLILATAARVALMPRRLRLISIVHHIEQTGLDAVPIIALINFLVGAVIAFLAGDILNNYGGSIFSVDLISIAFFREFGAILAAVMVAGRSGSAFTAEIGAMKGNEEIDAMRALGLEPVELLVLPRVIALLISLPLLTFLADMMGLLGGCMADWATLGLTPTSFINRLFDATAAKHVWVGLIKSPFFAWLIAMIGCYQGFKVTGSAESVGQRTTLSVVQSIFIVIVVDALFAIFFLEIHY